jgi:hypothetical protein
MWKDQNGTVVERAKNVEAGFVQCRSGIGFGSSAIVAVLVGVVLMSVVVSPWRFAFDLGCIRFPQKAEKRGGIMYVETRKQMSRPNADTRKMVA